MRVALRTTALLIGLLFFAICQAQTTQHKLTVAQPNAPSAEMKRLFDVFLGKWSFRAKLPSGQSGEGEQIWRTGPGGLILIEDFYGKTTGSVGFSVTWWDGTAGGYRALWCDSSLKSGCTVMSKLAQWEGSNFVLRDQFEQNGKKIDYKEVVSDITPTTYTQTIFLGDAGGELKPTTVIHATKVADKAN